MDEFSVYADESLTVLEIIDKLDVQFQNYRNSKDEVIETLKTLLVNSVITSDQLKVLEEYFSTKALELEDLESNYVPELNIVKSQLAERATNAEMELKRDKSVLIPLADFAQDARTAMTGGSVAVVGENAVIEANVVDDAVTPRKISFVDNLNVFNKATDLIAGATYDNDGVLFVRADLGRMKPYAVNVGDVIRFSKLGAGNLMGITLDTNLVFKSTLFGVAVVSGDGRYYTYTVPDGVRYIVLSVNLLDADSMIVTKNTPYPASHTPYAINMPTLRLAEQNYDNKSVPAEKTSFIKWANSFDKNNHLLSGYISNDGVVQSGFNRTDFVKITTGDVVRWSYSDLFAGQPGCVFNVNKVYASMITTAHIDSYMEYVATIDGYLEINLNAPADFMLTINNDFPTEYTKYGLAINNLLADKNEIIANVKAMDMTINADYSILFSNVACIGDSFTEGDYGNGNGVHAYNYPFCISKLTKWNVSNLGHSGQTSMEYWDRFASLANYSAFDTAIVFLGQNGGLTDTLASDTASQPYAATQTGSYCKIIEKILSDNPLCNIFLCTIPQNDADRSSINVVIEQIAVKYSLPVIDLFNDSVFTFTNGSLYRPYDNQHFGKVGYMMLASEILRLMKESVYHNITDYNVIDS